jgi:hypothetical protein
VIRRASLPKLPSGSAVLLAAVFLMLPFAAAVRGQVNVDLSIKRSIYIAYEPLLATVRISNLSGQQLLLADAETKKWFGFEVETLDGHPVPPSDPDYEIAPVRLEPGDSIVRTVNLTQLFPLGDLGSYRIRARVYAAELSSYFTSPPLTVEITEGRLIWQQTVGVPGSEGLAASVRTISLLSHRLADKTDLYLRIEDGARGIVYCTHRLGDWISYGKPDIQLDAMNAVHILQNNIPREFVYSKVAPDGKILERLTYSAPKDRPQLVKCADGSVKVSGGIPFDPKATPTPGPTSKLSDRPVPLDSEPPSLQIPSGSPKASVKPTPSPSLKQARPLSSPVPGNRID